MSEDRLSGWMSGNEEDYDGLQCQDTKIEVNKREAPPLLCVRMVFRMSSISVGWGLNNFALRTMAIPHFRRLIAQGLMQASLVVKCEILTQLLTAGSR